MANHPFRSNDAAIRYANEAKKAGLNIFFAVALFDAENRRKQNVLGLRSLFLDIDAGPTKPYVNQTEAQLALSDFIKSIGLPDPVVVLSGNGIHSYFIVPQSLNQSEWAELAEALRGACVAKGLKADHAITTDSARLLRVPGTQNHKTEGSPKLVSVATEISLSDIGVIRNALVPYIKNRQPNIEDANARFMANLPNTPKNANLIADQCAQVEAMRESRGSIPEPNWYATLGVLALCEDGELISQQWSEGHPTYDPEKTQIKFERAKEFAPTTCQRFTDISPALCEGCIHKGRIATPLQLGETPTHFLECSIPISDWPDPLSNSAFHGLAGEIVRAIEPHSEADPIALLIQILVGFGNVIGRHAHFIAEADCHYTNLFAVLVGATSKGRKGSSWGHIRKLFEAVDQDWSTRRIQSGLSSGEGLIWAVRDSVAKQEFNKHSKTKGPAKDAQIVIVDEGVIDKRLLAMEPEIASVLRVTIRDGNTVSATIRQAWDTGNLQTLTKNSPAHSTGAHISIVGHITKDELKRYMDNTETANGFANRFLWVCVKRSKTLPEGGQLLSVDFDSMVSRLRDAVDAAKSRNVLTRDEGAKALWHVVYENLSGGKPGLFGAVTGRSEAQVMRLACLYALLDQSTHIERVHLEAALAVWKFCEESARYIFGDTVGDPTADTILFAVNEAGNTGLTQTDIHKLFNHNTPANRINHALANLADGGLAVSQIESGRPGRPTIKWFSTRLRITK